MAQGKEVARGKKPGAPSGAGEITSTLGKKKKKKIPGIPGKKAKL